MQANESLVDASTVVEPISLQNGFLFPKSCQSTSLSFCLGQRACGGETGSLGRFRCSIHIIRKILKQLQGSEAVQFDRDRFNPPLLDVFEHDSSEPSPAGRTRLEATSCVWGFGFVWVGRGVWVGAWQGMVAVS